MLMSPVVRPFSINLTSTVTGVNFFWPEQIATSTSSIPFAYPPLISPKAGQSGSDMYFNNNAVINAYDVFKQELTDGPLGNLHMDEDIISSFHTVWQVNSIGEETYTAHSTINNGAYPSINGVFTNPFQKWALANGSYLQVDGNGVAGGACSSRNIHGFTTDNSIILGYAHAIYVPSGWLDEAHITGNDFNGNLQLVKVGAAGVLRGVEMTGEWLGGAGIQQGIVQPEPTFNFLGTCTNLNTTEVTIYGRITDTGQAGMFYFGGTNNGTVNLSGEIGLFNLGGSPLTAPSYFGIIDNPNVKANITGSSMWNKNCAPAANCMGIQVKQVKSFNFVGNNADQWHGLIDIASLSLANNPQITVTGNTVTGTDGLDAFILPADCSNVNFVFIGNNTDKQSTQCWPVYLTYPTTFWNPPCNLDIQVPDVAVIGQGGAGGGGAMAAPGAACSGGSAGGAGGVSFGTFSRGLLGDRALSLIIPGPSAGGAGAASAGPGSPAATYAGPAANFTSIMAVGWGGAGFGGQVALNSGGGGGGTALMLGKTDGLSRGDEYGSGGWVWQSWNIG